LAELADEELGMLAQNKLLPEKTSHGGYGQIVRNIRQKATVQRTRWNGIVTDIRRLQPDYEPIQKLRHDKLKYEQKHNAAVKREKVVKKKRQEAVKAKYLDDEAIEEEAFDDLDLT